MCQLLLKITKLWLSKGLMKSINTKNELYIKSKLNSNFKPVFNRYRNKLMTVICAATQQYFKNVPNSVKTNSAKLWAHLNFLIKTNSDKDLPITPANLNDFSRLYLNKYVYYQRDKNIQFILHLVKMLYICHQQHVMKL